MKKIIASLALAFAATTTAQAADTFKRPDCSAYKEMAWPEVACYRQVRSAVRYQNYEVLQKTGLEFINLERAPAGKELDAYPEAKKAAEAVKKGELEGEFVVKFSVNTEGKTYDVKVAESSSPAIMPLAKLWADTIGKWTFVKVDKPVTDVPFRRIYLFSKDEDARNKKDRQ